MNFVNENNEAKENGNTGGCSSLVLPFPIMFLSLVLPGSTRFTFLTGSAF